jgi:hypothetical protein
MSRFFIILGARTLTAPGKSVIGQSMTAGIELLAPSAKKSVVED